MDRIEVFQILGIEMTKDERSIKNAYRERLAVTNPEDNPEGFKRLREAYEEACRLARESDEPTEEQRDETASGIWVEKAAAVYGNMRSRRDTKAWEELFADDCFLSLEEEENCRIKLLRFIMDHFRLPGDVWKLLDKKLDITAGAAALREKFPADFIRYILSKCERGRMLNSTSLRERMRLLMICSCNIMIDAGRRCRVKILSRRSRALKTQMH